MVWMDQRGLEPAGLLLGHESLEFGLNVDDQLAGHVERHRGDVAGEIVEGCTSGGTPMMPKLPDAV